MPIDQLIAEVKKYALAKYEQGWDVVIETCEDADIAKIIEGATTPMGAKRKVSAALVQPYNEQRNAVLAEVF